MASVWVEAKLIGTLNSSLRKGMKVGVKPLGNGRFIVASPQWKSEPMVISEVQGRQAVRTAKKAGKFVEFRESARCEANCSYYRVS